MSVPVNQLLRTLQPHFFCFRQNSSLVSFIFIWEWELIDRYKTRQPQHSFLQLYKKACVKTLPNHQWLLQNNLPKLSFITEAWIPHQEHLPTSVLLQNNPRGNRNYFLLLCIQPIYSNKILRNLRVEQLVSKLIDQDVPVNPVADK